MGNPPVLETHDASNLAKKTKKSEKKRRRIHPIRRIAKFILGDGENPQRKQNNAQRLGDQLEEGKTCHGASRWHNLLPFLEPLFALDPKLSFIEDRILGRAPARSHTDDYAPISTTPPKSLAELQAHVQEADLPCTCDECAPKLYKISTLASHGALRDRRNKHTSKNHHRKTPSFSSEKVPKPTSPAPSLTLRFHGTYESMSLVRHHISWLDATYLHPSARPTPSVLHLRSLLSYWYPHLTSHDLRSTLSARQVTTLFAHLNRVFFAGNVPAHNDLLSAGFSYLDSRQSDCFGKSFYNPVVGTQVLLHPMLYRGYRPLDTPTQTQQARMKSRLGTLLHEMIHAFLKAYTCRSCPMWAACIGEKGHGRAWQVLARKVEQVAAVVVGGNVDLGRWQSALSECEGGGLPSVHDLEVWGMSGGGGGSSGEKGCC